ncbi:MAG: 4Fe-4S binding protein [Spirochaetes bacterium]|nr:4Fe-4S binding protein [Spirochaetota bacterium]
MKRILIDLTKCRECDECQALCEYYYHNNNRGVKNLIQKAVFLTTCRKCEDAPCVKSCPQEALEKNKDNILQKNNNLCISCKSCVIACPFGTLPDFLFEYLDSSCDFCNISEGTDDLKCIKSCPKKAISLTEEEPSAEKHIYLIADRLLVKDYKWEEFVEK